MNENATEVYIFILLMIMEDVVTVYVAKPSELPSGGIFKHYRLLCKM